MTFEQLECFIQAVQEKTFFDAAEALHITQSSLSKQIKKLEAELSIQLFDRSRRSAHLTQAGEFFYPEARKLVQQYQHAIEQLRDFNTSVSSSLCVGTLPVLSQYGLIPDFSSFCCLTPKISLSLLEVENRSLCLALRMDVLTVSLPGNLCLQVRIWFLFHWPWILFL